MLKKFKSKEKSKTTVYPSQPSALDNKTSFKKINQSCRTTQSNINKTKPINLSLFWFMTGLITYFTPNVQVLAVIPPSAYCCGNVLQITSLVGRGKLSTWPQIFTLSLPTTTRNLANTNNGFLKKRYYSGKPSKKEKTKKAFESKPLYSRCHRSFS